MTKTTTRANQEYKCDFCGKVAKYDGKTKMGPWANMCESCFKINGVGLGLGKGQRFVK